MKVHQLLDLLQKLNPEADIIIHRDCQNYGFGIIDKIETGVFEPTEYGNEFWPDQKLVVNPAQVRSVCLFPEDFLPAKAVTDTAQH